MSRRALAIKDTADIVLARDRWSCVVCGRPATQLAHRVPQRVWLLNKYGTNRIHHSDNLRAVCSLTCNAKAQAPQGEWETIMEDIENEN